MVMLSIEGNIGAGKSTLLAALPRLLPGARLLPEPVDRWRETGVLGLFYRDPQRWAYSFQSYAFLSRLRAQVDASRSASLREAPLTVLERSVWSDKHVFAANCRATGLFAEAAEGAMYDDWHGWLMERAFPAETRLDGIIYLRASPEVCHARIAGRARGEEAAIPLTYLQELHARHERWLIGAFGAEGAEGAEGAFGAPRVLVIDGDTLDWADAAAVEALGARLRVFAAACAAAGGASRDFAADPPRELEVLREDGDAAGVDRA